MIRKAMEDLIAWKNQKRRKPLLIYGARQVGKTYLIKEFGKNNYENVIYVDFEQNSLVNNMINEDITPEYIISNLEMIFEQKIDKDKTLIIFDEIQKNSRALTSLKYFCDDAPEYHIIAAGSLLGVFLAEKDYSFPVGKVDFLTIYPMSFDEFLINTNNKLLKDKIIECFNNNKELDKVLHEKALGLYYNYLILGGMPEVVQEYINSNSIISAVGYQASIINAYKSDIMKYVNDSRESNKILATFNSIPAQLAKDNKKFQYKLIQKGGSSTIFGESVDWLVNSAIVNKCIKSKVGVPLKMYEEMDSFKLYMNDVGLLVNLSEFPIYLIRNREAVNESMLGMLTENYVASSLKYNGFSLHYWKNEWDSEIDFIVQSQNGLIIPIEVKTSTHTKSRSLNNYNKEYNPKYAIRISEKNFGFINNIKSIPLYATFCITSENLDI